MRWTEDDLKRIKAKRVKGGLVGTDGDKKRRCIDLAYGASRKTETDTDQAGSNPAPSPTSFVLRGQIPSGKNAVLITRSGRRYPGKRFKVWRDEAMRQLPADIVAFDGPVRMMVEYTPGDHRRRDVPGILDALCHLIEKSGIVLDDAQVRNVHWFTLPVSEPKCKVMIQPIDVTT